MPCLYNLYGERECKTYHVHREVEGAGKSRQRRSMLKCVAIEGIPTTALFSDLCLLGLSTTLLGCSAVSVPCSRALECSAVAAERVQCSSRAAAAAASASSSKTSLISFSSRNCYCRGEFAYFQYFIHILNF